MTIPNYTSLDPRLDDDSIDFKRYFSLFISNWYWFAVALFISLSIAYSVNRWSEKRYIVSSTLLIKDDQNSALTSFFEGTGGFRSQQNLQNEIGILKSYKLNRQVMEELPDFYVEYIKVGKRGIAELRMYNRSPFRVDYNSLEKQSIGQRVKIKIMSGEKYRLEINSSKNFEKEMNFGDRFSEMGFDFVINLRNKETYRYKEEESNKYYFYFDDPATLANRYRSKLSVTPVETDASLVTLTTTGFVPEQEADYLNMLMKVYLDFGLEYKNETAIKTIEFIEKQLGQISDSLQIAEINLENFRLINKLIDISSEGVIIKDKLKQIDEEKTKLQLQENYLRYLKDYIVSKTGAEDVVAPSVMNIIDPLLIRYVTELSDLQKEKKQISMNFEENQIPIKLLEARIVTVQNAIKENITNGLRNIDWQKKEMEEQLMTVEKEIRKLPSTERQLINIQRKVDINNTVYTFLLEKRAEAEIAKASNVSDNRIIDRAGSYSGSKIRPREKRNIRMAFLIGLLIPFAGIILIDFLNNRIIDKKDVERGTNVPILGLISHSTLKKDIPVAEKPGSTLSESFRSVRTNLKYFLKEIKCPVIAVTSTITAEGKTFIAGNLAAIIAMSDKKVLLAGLDMRKPRIHKILSTNNNDVGISNFLIGEEKFEDIIIKTEVNNLWYAPSGPVPPNPAELIESPAMADFIEKAKKQFDYIIIDTPPVAIVTDALLVSPLTDFYIFVVRQRYTTKNTLGLIEELYKNKQLKDIGIVINDISLSGYYGYGLRYGYSIGYGYNYGYNYYSQYTKYGYYDSAKGYFKEDT